MWIQWEELDNTIKRYQCTYTFLIIISSCFICNSILFGNSHFHEKVEKNTNYSYAERKNVELILPDFVILNIENEENGTYSEKKREIYKHYRFHLKSQSILNLKKQKDCVTNNTADLIIDENNL